MIRIEKLNEDAQIAIMIIIAKKALSYLEKDTCTAKHVVETQNAEYPVEGVSVIFRLQMQHLKNAGNGLRQKTLLCWTIFRS